MSEKKYQNYFSGIKNGIVTNLTHLKAWFADQINPRDEGEVEWRALARTFLKLGLTGFGGGIAVLAQIRNVVVRDRKWMSENEFLDAVSLAQSLPGANAVNAITYVGLKVAGIRGAIISACGYIFPSFLIMIALSIAHDYLQYIPDAQKVFQGFNAAVVGLIGATTVRLGKTAVKQQWHLELGCLIGFILIFTQTTVVEAVLLAGIIGIFIRSYKSRLHHRVKQKIQQERKTYVREIAAEQQARQQAAETIAEADNLSSDYKVESALGGGGAQTTTPPDDSTKPPPSPPTEPTPPDQNPDNSNDKPASASNKMLSIAPIFLLLFLFSWSFFSKLVTVWQLMTIFLRVGTVTFGGGFVMVPQIEADVVDIHKWMNHQSFADGMAFGQLTPGPVLITATFIGYKVAGLGGAIASTICAFLPAFIMSVIAGTSINRFRTNFLMQSFLSGVAPAVVGMLAAAGVALAKSGLNTPLSYGVATLAFLLMLRAKINPVLIIFGCGLFQWAVARGLIGWLHI